ncbi:MAG: FAD-binding domain-containing protein [Chthoniobacterales bacterium]
MPYADSSVARVHRATRLGGMELLERFLPRANEYASRRNFDLGPGDRTNVSRLSPYLTTRLLNQRDVLEAVVAAHPHHSVEKYTEELAWRTYWKGHLEMHPTIWSTWIVDCEKLTGTPADDAAKAAVTTPTGIDCFDAWAAELIETGYLHNHARMWFASIWIFTLGLPWQLGARFFYEHLLDADSASNTLSWRWVAGLQTKGKRYLATAENISRFTKGRFNGSDRLVEDPDQAPVITDEHEHPFRPLDLPPTEPPVAQRIGVLLHGDDCSFEIALNASIQPVALASGWPFRFTQITGWQPEVTQFRRDAVVDATERAVRRWNLPNTDLSAARWAHAVNDWADAERLDAIFTPYLPVGPWRDFLRPRLEEVRCPVHEVLRTWDRALWPHADRGFFQLRNKLPATLGKLGVPGYAEDT